MEGGGLAPKMLFALQEVGKKCHVKNNPPDRYFPCCRSGALLGSRRDGPCAAAEELGGLV